MGEDNSMEVEVEFDGKVQFTECRHCGFLITGNEGGNAWWQHHKICPEKAQVVKKRQKDSYSPNVTLDNRSSVIPKKLQLNMWEALTPIYVNGELQAADCIHCHECLSINGGHLSRHAHNHEKGYCLSLPNLKFRVQDEMSPDFANGKVRIVEYSSKLGRPSRSGDTTRGPVQVVADHQSLPASESK